MSTNEAPFIPFWWPDHVIGKRESRAIREQHNALFNSHAELLIELHAGTKIAELIALHWESGNLSEAVQALARWEKAARKVIAKAEGRA